MLCSKKKSHGMELYTIDAQTTLKEEDDVAKKE